MSIMKVCRLTKTMSDSEKFLNKIFDRHVSSSIISMFGVMASVMANSIIAGKFFGTDGLAVMSVVAPFYSLFATVGALAGVGGATLSSHALGRDNLNDANKSFTLSIILSAGIYLVVASISFIFLDNFLYLLGSSEQIFEQAKNYSQIYIIGGFGITLMYLPYNFFKLIGKLKLLKSMYLGIAVVNIFLDIFFVKVLGFGIEGIALGTVIATLGISLFGMKFLLVGKNSFSLERCFDFDTVRDLLRLGTPSALNNLLTFFRLLIMNRIIVAAAGSAGLAAFSVFSALEKFSLVILSGLAQATVAFIGVFSKERDTLSVRIIEKRAHLIGVIFILPMMFGIIFFATEICNFFGIYDGYRLSIAENAAKLFALSLPPSICCLLMFSYFQASGFTNLANILIFSRSFVFLILPAYFLTPLYGLDATWFSMTIASVAPLAIMLLALPYYFKKGYSGIFLQNLEAEKSGKYISFTVNTNPESITESVAKITDFCKRNDLSKKEIMLVSLSMEEMMMSITEHCFENVSEGVMDVRILILKKVSDLMIILRIRNGGKLFNPIEYFEKVSAEDPLAMGDALGIAMIVKAASAIHYMATFGVNNLTVIINRQEKIQST